MVFYIGRRNAASSGSGSSVGGIADVPGLSERLDGIDSSVAAKADPTLVPQTAVRERVGDFLYLMYALSATAARNEAVWRILRITIADDGGLTTHHADGDNFYHHVADDFATLTYA